MKEKNGKYYIYETIKRNENSKSVESTVKIPLNERRMNVDNDNVCAREMEKDHFKRLVKQYKYEMTH